MLGSKESDTLKAMCDFLIEIMENCSPLSVSTDFDFVGLKGIFESGTGFVDQMSVAQKGALKDVIRPYQAVLRSVV